ncbi:hypothetical protein CYLTODRAFT_448503 [Cylindrobasidium torrendii FP15055 ss-10]|uniref:Protein YOP1 n=1 Tax=Cylindrobasidium torrendii FP15055 ss-10 TaxID=1314674 RepID=A0A0D7BUH9_9AGAR|nr:hypothetical protein CYLTODRAFT_448503 [Cylindrobasidium torrendii FP15055 ss-10]
MPLFVHILRVALLFQNTFDTFKTLKAPPPSRSSRNAGQPSRSALSKRKRDMKGCLAMWIVWCCLMIYDRHLESLVSIFIPFYDEFKSLALVFFILTRAKGAEPIYLHIIRPVLKPYAPTVDAILDLCRMAGDIVFLMAATPIRAVIAYIPWFGTGQHAYDDDPTPVQTRSNSSFAGPGMGERTPSTSSDVSGQGGPNVSATLQYQIWHPQSTASGEPGVQQTVSYTAANGHGEIQEIYSEEWRKYPEFPSAYPATPLVHNGHLPPPRAAVPAFAPIEEDEVEPFIPPPLNQDFEQSLSKSRGPMNPTLDDLLSDNATIPAGQHYPSPTISSSHVGNISVSSDALSDEDDEFDKTLRTPQPIHSRQFESETPMSISPLSSPFGLTSPTHSIKQLTTPSRPRQKSQIPTKIPSPIVIDLPTPTTTSIDPDSASPMDTDSSNQQVGPPTCLPLASTPASPSRPTSPAQIPVKCASPRKRTLKRALSPETPRKARTRASSIKRRATGISQPPKTKRIPAAKKQADEEPPTKKRRVAPVAGPSEPVRRSRRPQAEVAFGSSTMRGPATRSSTRRK